MMAGTIIADREDPMRLALAAAMLATLSPAALAADVTRIDVLDTGTFVTETGAVTPDANMPHGETVAVTGATPVDTATTVPAVIGTDFGFRYVVVGSPEGAPVALDFVSIYPEPGLADPEADAPFREARFTREKAIGVPDYFGYKLEEPWEAVAGEWRFEIWHDGRKLAERTFTTTAPE